jgi:uncharacterized protein (DUF2062 family)
MRDFYPGCIMFRKSADFRKRALSVDPGRKNLPPGKRLRRFVRYWYLRVARIQASPHAIALGLAVGVFAGILPVLPFQTALAVALAFALRGSMPAALLGTWVSNPLDWVPLYLLCYSVGRAVVPFEVPAFDAAQLGTARMLELGWTFFAVMLAGGLAVAAPAALLTYFLALRGVKIVRAREKAGFGAARTDRRSG